MLLSIRLLGSVSHNAFIDLHGPKTIKNNVDCNNNGSCPIPHKIIEYNSDFDPVKIVVLVVDECVLILDIANIVARFGYNIVLVVTMVRSVWI